MQILCGAWPGFSMALRVNGPLRTTPTAARVNPGRHLAAEAQRRPARFKCADVGRRCR